MALPLGSKNGTPWIRGLRVLAVAMALGAVAAGLQALTAIDWPGGTDAAIVAGGTAAFVWVDKWLRGAD